MSKSFSDICWKCGACCKMLKNIPELADLDRGDGQCRHLQDDLTCGIYETRPTACNVDKLKKLMFSSISDEEYHDMMRKYCEYLDEKVNKKSLKTEK